MYVESAGFLLQEILFIRWQHNESGGNGPLKTIASDREEFKELIFEGQ